MRSSLLDVSPDVEVRISLIELPDRVGRAESRRRLLEILAAELGVEPGVVRLTAAPGGKPILDPRAGLPDLRFSVAHSANRQLVAVCDASEVGVDIEQHRLRARIDGLARRAMSEAELDAWRAVADPAERAQRFYDLWTRKEAYVKGLGTGLVTDLATVELEPASRKPRTWRVARRDQDPSWWIAELEVGAGWSAAVACERGPIRVSTRG